MKKINFIAIVFLLPLFSFAQKYICRDGEIKFEASMPSFEEVKAVNKTASGVLNVDNGEFAALVLIKGFRFKVALMEEHFNENYMESDQFPKATFKGKINNFDSSKLSSSDKAFDIEGKLTIHGITKDIKTKIIFVKKGNSIVSKCKFTVKPEDYKIEIPKLVEAKISENISIEANFDLKSN